MPSLHRFAAPRTPTRSAGLALVLLWLATLLPTATVVAGQPTTAASTSPKPGSRVQPTIHWEEAVAHEHDRIPFKAGGRVSVPFEPRKGDRWKVGGGAPRALPAGRLSGQQLRVATPPAALDAPVIDPAATIDADAASWSGAPDPEPISLTASVDPGGLKREVFGFLPYWELTDSSTTLDWAKLSTVAYFGVGAAADGSLQKRNSDGTTTVGWSGWTSSALTNVINAAHRSGARVVLTVQSFAWTTSGANRQKALLGSSTARANLAAQIAKAVRDRGADGVNLDFEPIVSGYADEFTALVRKVRSTLDATAKGYQLTFDTTGWIGNYPIEAATASGGADAIMIMGYDYRSSSAATAGSIAPIRSSIYDISETLSAYLGRVPASKLILGVPYYGRAWSTPTDLLHAENISGTKYGASATAVYTTARSLAVDHGRRWDSTEGVAWTAYKRQTCTSTYGCVTAWRQLYYDDAAALGRKYDLVNASNLRGVGLWALGYDGTRPELYQALKDKFITDSVPPAITSSSLSASSFSPNGDGRIDTVTASLSASALVRWGYRVQPLSGTTLGAAIRSGTVNDKTPKFTWNGRDSSGAVAANGRYVITLWAGDASDNRSQKTFTVTLDTRAASVSTKAEDGAFSPDGNGWDDTMSLSWTASEPIRGTVRILDSAGRSRKVWYYESRTSWATTWNGRNDAGTKLPNGRYTYRVRGSDRAGNLRTVDRSILIDDTIRKHTWSDYSFDPRDGLKSRMYVGLRRSAKVTAAIYLGSTKVRSIWTGRSLVAGTYGWTWNGRTASGAWAKPGKYTVLVKATSRYGTTSWKRTVTIEVH